jgi:ribosomal-protein-alanine N-acetyltransferase
MLVRNVKTSDLPEICEIEKFSFDREAYSKRFIETLICHFGDTFLVAEDQGRIVGYAVAVLDGEVGHIYSIAVHPTARKEGVGRILLTSLVERMRAKGLSRARLEVREDNLPAQALYKRLGFVVEGRIESYYSDRRGAIVMSKALN